MILLIDNYDSFVYNLYQQLAQGTEQIQIFRNDKISLSDIEAMQPTHIVLSPGPGRPEDAGICVDLIRQFSGRVPILGVCLGHQAIGVAFGGQVVAASKIVHGKPETIFHSRQNLYQHMPCPFTAGRYHSLIIERATLPAELIVEAETSEGLIMGVRHKSHPTFGVQYHPESILTPDGPILLQEFVKT